MFGFELRPRYDSGRRSGGIVVSEDDRVKENSWTPARPLRSAPQWASLFVDSHHSLQFDYEVSLRRAGFSRRHRDRNGWRLRRSDDRRRFLAAAP